MSIRVESAMHMRYAYILSDRTLLISQSSRIEYDSSDFYCMEVAKKQRYRVVNHNLWYLNF